MSELEDQEEKGKDRLSIIRASLSMGLMKRDTMGVDAMSKLENQKEEGKGHRSITRTSLSLGLKKRDTLEADAMSELEDHREEGKRHRSITMASLSEEPKKRDTLEVDAMLEMEGQGEDSEGSLPTTRSSRHVTLALKKRESMEVVEAMSGLKDQEEESEARFSITRTPLALAVKKRDSMAVARCHQDQYPCPAVDAVLLFEKRQELQSSEAQLQEAKFVFEARMAELRLRWRRLEDRKLAFLETWAFHLRKYDALHAAEKRARGRANRQREIVDRLHSHLTRLRWKLNKTAVQLQNRIRMKYIYDTLKDIVQMVIGTRHGFGSFKEMVCRHKSLLHTQGELLARTEIAFNAIHATRAEMRQYVTKVRKHHVLSNERISQLYNVLQVKQEEVMRLEKKYQNMLAEGSHLTLNLGYINVTIHSIYDNINRFQGCEHHHHGGTNTQQELDFIVDFLTTGQRHYVVTPEATEDKQSGGHVEKDGMSTVSFLLPPIEDDRQTNKSTSRSR